MIRENILNVYDEAVEADKESEFTITFLDHKNAEEAAACVRKVHKDGIIIDYYLSENECNEIDFLTFESNMNLLWSNEKKRRKVVVSSIYGEMKRVNDNVTVYQK